MVTKKGTPEVTHFMRLAEVGREWAVDATIITSLPEGKSQTEPCRRSVPRVQGLGASGWDVPRERLCPGPRDGTAGAVTPPSRQLQEPRAALSVGVFGLLVR